MKGFLEEFRKFINRGNALELAIGVVIGSSFSAIVNSLVNDVITPIIGGVVGGIDFTGIKIPLGRAGESYIMIGNFIQTVLDFVLVAFVLFLIIRSFNKANELAKARHKQQEVEVKKEDPEDIKLLKSIESELKKLNKKSSK